MLGFKKFRGLSIAVCSSSSDMRDYKTISVALPLGTERRKMITLTFLIFTPPLANLLHLARFFHICII